MDKNIFKDKKFLTIGAISLAALIIIILLLVFIIGGMGKPSKKVSEELVKNYLKAVNNDDGDKFLDLIDVNGYIIYNNEDIKRFDKKYKDKEAYMKKYIKDKDYDNVSDVKDSIGSSFKSKYSYNYVEYSLKEIKSIEKSNKSSKISIIKAKVKTKSKYYDTTDSKNLKLYVIKSSGKYKIVGAELE